MDKKIIVTAEIAFAMAFIVVMALIMSTVSGFGTSTNKRLTNMRETAQMAEFAPYNEGIVSGDTVISTINKLKETPNGTKMSYGVCHGGNMATSSNWKFYGIKRFVYASGQSALYTANNAVVSNLKIGSAQAYTTYDVSTAVGAAGYISPAKEYRASILHNKNGNMMGIIFVEV